MLNEKRKEKVMKKIVLTVVAMLTMTMAFAEGDNNNATENVNAYAMNINVNKLGNALGLDIYQMDAVEDIAKSFSTDMQNVAEADKDARQAAFKKAIHKNLNYIHSVLDEDQYHKYLLLLNTTLNNRGLNK